MRRIGGWAAALATLLASLVVSVAFAGAALGHHSLQPTDQPRPEVGQASGDWLPAIVVFAIVLATSVILASSIHFRHLASRRGSRLDGRDTG